MQTEKNDRYVLITGASAGIGYELCKQFAKDNHNLILVSRDEKKLNRVAEELREHYRIKTKVISKDLSVKSAATEIYEVLSRESIAVEILVNNAGFNVYGSFFETDLSKELEMIQLNLVSLVQLTKMFLPGMIKNRSGRILNIGSTGSYVPGPLNAVYCATKAFVRSFSEALAEETQGSGVTVTILCPGATATEFAKRAHIENTRLFMGRKMTADAVAKIGYQALMGGKRTVIAGIENKLQVFSTHFASNSMVTRMVKKAMTRVS